MHRISAVLVGVFGILPAVCAGQVRPAAAPAAGTQAAPAAQAASAATPAAAVTASALLQPSLTVVQNALHDLKLDKWKKGSVREEAAQNVNSILHDIQTNLPPLMAAADAAPSSVGAAVPLMKHLDAVYDVLLRVEEAARVAAPGGQINDLQLALTSLGSARFAFDDQIQRQAQLDEKELVELRARMAKEGAGTRTVAGAPEAKPCVPAKPTVRKRRTRKPAAAQKPSNTAKPAAGQPATTTH